MAFGITREELNDWKAAVSRGEIAFLTHYWLDERFPHMKTVTKVGCSNYEKLMEWCRQHHLNPGYIHAREKYPHFDLIGEQQKKILQLTGQYDQIKRFGMMGD